MEKDLGAGGGGVLITQPRGSHHPCWGRCCSTAALRSPLTHGSVSEPNKFMDSSLNSNESCLSLPLRPQKEWKVVFTSPLEKEF